MYPVMLGRASHHKQTAMRQFHLDLRETFFTFVFQDKPVRSDSIYCWILVTAAGIPGNPGNTRVPAALRCPAGGAV
jgi:hypothetical protein